MREYTIQIQFVVDAHDEEAADIARAVREQIVRGTGITHGHGYKLRDVETYKIEEL